MTTTEALTLARNALADLVEAADSMRGTYGCIQGRHPEDDDTYTHEKWAEGFLHERAELARAAIDALAQQPSAPSAEPAAEWLDPRVQAAYEILCSDDTPPPEQHWEGWVARRIVDAIGTAPTAPAPLPAATASVAGLVGELPDAIRLPLHKLWADAGYLVGRAIEGDRDMAVHRIKTLCDEVERAIRATPPAPSAPTVQPLSDDAMKWRKAVQEAYGWLWHTNNEPMAPVPMWSPEQAAYQARKCLRELLTTAERGEAINAIAAHMDKIAGITAAPTKE